MTHPTTSCWATTTDGITSGEILDPKNTRCSQVIHHCLTCYKFKVKASQQFMGQLPQHESNRLDHSLQRASIMQDPSLELCLCVVIFKTCFFNAQSHLTLTALHEHFLYHTPGLTHPTPQLRLRRDRPMFAAADFKPSDVRFNVRWST